MQLSTQDAKGSYTWTFCLDWCGIHIPLPDKLFFVGGHY